MIKQAQLIEHILQLQTRIQQAAPFRDFGLKPNPRAAEPAILAAEARLARPLPPSYRAFLRRYDGWPRFFEGATLLGTANLGLRVYEDMVRAALEAAETPVPDVGPPARRRDRLPPLIPFGADMQQTTVFAFDASSPEADGELSVIAWVNEIGVRRANFEDFLEMVVELCEAELSERVGLERKSA